VCYVEREAYAAANLVARMEDQTLDYAPIWDDVKTFDGYVWSGVVDCITAGYPCQPFSIAGRKKGSEDPRHLWPDIKRIVGEVQPQFCFLENVSNHLNMGFDTVSRDLQALGYSVAATLVAAEEIGAPHRRERLFILANSKSRPIRLEPEWYEQLKTICGYSEPRNDRGEDVAYGHRIGFKSKWGKQSTQWDHVDGGGGEKLANAQSEQRGSLPGRNIETHGRREHTSIDKNFPPGQDPNNSDWTNWPWPSFEPGFRRGSYGATKWNDRLRLCGNGVVPLVAGYALGMLLHDFELYSKGAEK